MTRRAEVWRRWWGTGWGVILFDSDNAPDRSMRIIDRPHMHGARLRPGSGSPNFDTHAEALEAALEAVSISPAPEHREAP